MKLRLFFLCVLISGIAAAQPTNYTKINARYNWMAGYFSDGLTVPVYNGTPTLRTGVWGAAGNIGIDTLNHLQYFYSGGTFRRLALYSELGSVTVAGNYGNVQLNRYGLAAAGSDSLTFSAGLSLKGKVTVDGLQTVYVPNQTNFTGSLGIGRNALNNLSHSSGLEGQYNTAVGWDAMVENTTGYLNTGFGVQALNKNTTGYYNTGLGGNALYKNTTGIQNTAVGAGALQENTTGSYNVAVGSGVLTVNTTGQTNVAIGDNAMLSNTTGLQNTVAGYRAFQNNTIGYFNDFYGYRAGESYTAAVGAVGIGNYALGKDLTGRYNTAVGFFSGYDLQFSDSTAGYNVFLGSSAGDDIVTGKFNTVLGAGTTGSTALRSSILLGYGATTSTNNQFVVTDSITSYKFPNVPYSGSSSDSMVVWNTSSKQLGMRAIPTGGTTDFDWDWTEQFIPTLVTPFSYYASGSGSGSALTLDPSNSGLYNNGYGWAKFVTGTTSAGYAGFRTSNSDATRYRSTNAGTVTIQFDNVGFGTLSDGTDTYTVYIGSMPYSSSSEPNNGIYFKYTHSVNSGNWTCVTANGGSRTSTNSTTAVAANTAYDLKISITSGTATFYINGTQVASQSTNFPDNVAMQPWHGMIVKSAGTSDRDMWIDAVRLKYE